MQRVRDTVVSGASYVAFGGFYPTCVRQYEVTTPTRVIAQAISELAMPVCVIGGMTARNRTPLIALGAHMKTAIGSVHAAGDPHMAAVELSALFR